jgi:hypothetical protein
MEQKYFINEKGERKGPFSLEELKNQDIERSTMIWTEGLDGWKKAEEISDLKDLISLIPPPVVNVSSSGDKYFGYTLAESRVRLIARLIETVLLFPMMFLPVFGAIILCVLLGAVFYPVWSGSLGHKLMGLKVISSVDGKDYCKASEGAYRELLLNIFGFAIIPVMWLLWDADKQNLYDKVTKTYVVKVK